MYYCVAQLSETIFNLNHSQKGKKKSFQKGEKLGRRAPPLDKLGVQVERASTS